MSVISRRFADELTEKEAREAFLEEQTRVKLAQQIQTLRVQRNWSQSQLGALMKKPQSNIHRLEDKGVARYTLTTLFELAAAFDTALIVKFASFDEFLRDTNDLGPTALQVRSFSREELEALCLDSDVAPFDWQLPMTQALSLGTAMNSGLAISGGSGLLAPSTQLDLMHGPLMGATSDSLYDLTRYPHHAGTVVSGHLLPNNPAHGSRAYYQVTFPVLDEEKEQLRRALAKSEREKKVLQKELTQARRERDAALKLANVSRYVPAPQSVGDDVPRSYIIDPPTFGSMQ